jgi:hypothetical protein
MGYLAKVQGILGWLYLNKIVQRHVLDSALVKKKWRLFAICCYIVRFVFLVFNALSMP